MSPNTGRDSSFIRFMIAVALMIVIFQGDPCIAESLRVMVANAAELKP